jgi:hypothetical protein
MVSFTKSPYRSLTGLPASDDGVDSVALAASAVTNRLGIVDDVFAGHPNAGDAEETLLTTEGMLSFLAVIIDKCLLMTVRTSPCCSLRSNSLLALYINMTKTCCGDIVYE